MPHHKKKIRLRLRSFYLWHRYIGIIAALLVVVLAVTGILLNHTEHWRLDRRYVQSPILLDWYGIPAPDIGKGFPVAAHFITQVEDRLYLDTTPLPGPAARLVGALAWQGILVAATDNSILLLTNKGELIERLSAASGIPQGIRHLGLDPPGKLVIETRQGRFQPDADFLRWSAWNGNPAHLKWSLSRPLPEDLRQTLARQSRQHIVPLERFLLDLHSGRFIAGWGPYLMDAAALALLLLSASGSFLWWQQLRKRRRHRKK